MSRPTTLCLAAILLLISLPAEDASAGRPGLLKRLFGKANNCRTIDTACQPTGCPPVATTGCSASCCGGTPSPSGVPKLQTLTPCLNDDIRYGGCTAGLIDETECCDQMHADDLTARKACRAAARYRYRICTGEFPYPDGKQRLSCGCARSFPDFCDSGVVDYDCGDYCGAPYFCCKEREAICAGARLRPVPQPEIPDATCCCPPPTTCPPPVACPAPTTCCPAPVTCCPKRRAVFQRR